MASLTEVQSLEEISYRSRVKVYLWPLITLFLFTFAFLNFYPVGEKIKVLLKAQLGATGCNLDYNNVELELFMPKIVVNELVLPPQCLGRTGAPLKFDFLKINFQFVSFVPFGLPFRIDTQFNSQPISLYYVQGFSERMIRMKDQNFVLSKLESLLGEKLKLTGSVAVDINALVSNQNVLKSLSLKAQSKDFVIPPQSVEGYTTPKLKVNDLYLEVNSANPPKVLIEKLIIGDPDSPMRANFKGTIGLQQGNIPMSQLNLSGEIAFSEAFKETIPVDMFLGQFTQKDGFYQIRVGGILSSPKLSTP